MNGKVIVAGGSGFMGSALVTALRFAGYEPRVLTRKPTRPHDVEWDGRTAGAWVDQVKGAVAVVNLAGENVDGRRWTPALKEQIANSRVLTTDLLVSAMAGASPRPGVLINASALDYADQQGDEPVYEGAAAGTGFLAQVCVAWEEAAARATAVGVRPVMVRTPFVIAHNSNPLRVMVRPFRFYLGGRLGSGEQWFPWIHLDDWIAMCLRAFTDESLSGPVHAVAPEEVRQRDVAQAVGRIIHRPSSTPLPSAVLRMLLGQQADLVLEGQRARSSKLHDFEFAYPTIEGALRQALA